MWKGIDALSNSESLDNADSYGKVPGFTNVLFILSISTSATNTSSP